MKIDSEKIFEKYILPGFIILVLFMASTFIYGFFYNGISVPINEATHVKATFMSYKKKYYVSRGPSYTPYAVLYFADYESLEIRPELFNEKVEQAIQDIDAGTKLTLIIYPNSDIILDLEVKGDKILCFDESQKIRKREKTGFLFMGIAIYIICFLLFAYVNKRKRKTPRYVRFKI